MGTRKLQAEARLLVVDPLQAYLGNDVHMQQADDMRQAMNHLSAVAERTKCAIIMIGHMNKANGGKSLYRGLGSIDIVAAARSVLLVGRSQEDSSIRVVAQIKNSLAQEGATLAFELSKEQGIRWIGQYDMSIDEILNRSSDGSNTKVDKACDELKRRLQGGRTPCSVVYAALEAEGISKRTVDIAKKTLNIVSRKFADGWYWMLPAAETEEA